MSTNEINNALQIVAEAFRDDKINLKSSLREAIKKAYGVEDLNFWSDNAGWFYCMLEGIDCSDYYKKESFDEILIRLKSLQQNKGCVFFGRERFESLDDLKERVLIMKLSGLVEELKP